jgi:hypothetical protein
MRFTDVRLDSAGLRDEACDGDNRRPNREVGDEVAVRYVKVQNGRPPFDGSLRLGAEAHEISRENRSDELDLGMPRSIEFQVAARA